MITFKAILIEKKEVAPNVFLLTFQNNKSYHFGFQAGQYVIVNIPNSQGALKRLYSVASSPLNTDRFDLLIRRVDGGLGSQYITQLVGGDFVEMMGPAGVFTLRENTSPKIFLATGTGLAPIRSFLQSFPNLHAFLFWGAPYLQDVYFLDFFKQLSNSNPFFKLTICLSKESFPVVSLKHNPEWFVSGRINPHLKEFLLKTKNNHNINSFEYYLCGSRIVVESLKNDLLSFGVERGRVFFEKY